MNVLLLTIGAEGAAARGAAALVELAGPSTVERIVLPDGAGKEHLDPVLDRLAGRRLVVAGSRAAIGDVVVRLLRRDQLAGTPVALLASAADPAAVRPASRHGPFGEPAEPGQAARTALYGVPRPADLIRDDHGGVLLDRAELRPWDGRRLGVRAYADDQPVADGELAGLEVFPAGSGSLVARALPTRRWPVGRSTRRRGRAVQVSCAPARLTVDGRQQSRPVTRRTWWVEPARWWVVGLSDRST